MSCRIRMQLSMAGPRENTANRNAPFIGLSQASGGMRSLGNSVKSKRRMRLLLRSMLIALSCWSCTTFAATDNSGNSPAFIMIDLCSNGIGDSDPSEDAFTVPRMQPDVFDIGLDIDADGTID